MIWIELRISERAILRMLRVKKILKKKFFLMTIIYLNCRADVNFEDDFESNSSVATWKDDSENTLKFGAMHLIYQINRLTTTKVGSTYLG